MEYRRSFMVACDLIWIVFIFYPNGGVSFDPNWNNFLPKCLKEVGNFVNSPSYNALLCIIAVALMEASSELISVIDGYLIWFGGLLFMGYALAL